LYKNPRLKIKSSLTPFFVRSLNYKPKGLKTLLGRAMRGEQLEIVVAHKDRLARFGLELIRVETAPERGNEKTDIIT